MADKTALGRAGEQDDIGRMGRVAANNAIGGPAAKS